MQGMHINVHRVIVKALGIKHGKKQRRIVRDPKTGKPINPNEPWNMGHKPGYEFRKHRASAQERGIDRKQFLDEHNDSSHYRPELPSSNRSHSCEDMTDQYLGP